MEIIPAILPKDFSELEEKISLIRGLASIAQIDICDGKFVSSYSWPYRKYDENFEKIIQEERGMPSWENINYEFDLMIDNPTEDELRKWISAGAERIVLHVESADNLMECIKLLSGLVEIGIAIDVKTDINVLSKYIDDIQFIQCMGIDNDGYQGQKFNPAVIEKIKSIKNHYPNIQIQVDGGVSLENAILLKHAGASRLVLGSALFESENILETYNRFLKI